MNRTFGSGSTSASLGASFPPDLGLSGTPSSAFRDPMSPLQGTAACYARRMHASHQGRSAPLDRARAHPPSRASARRPLRARARIARAHACARAHLPARHSTPQEPAAVVDHPSLMPLRSPFFEPDDLPPAAGFWIECPVGRPAVMPGFACVGGYAVVGRARRRFGAVRGRRAAPAGADS